MSKKRGRGWPTLEVGCTLGKWTLEKKLGEGGNGWVWKVNNLGDKAFAIKILKKSSKKMRQRFSDEIFTMKEYMDLGGIMPIIDENLNYGSEPLWYVMPLAKSLDMIGLPITKRVEMIIAVASTMERLHDQGVSHRDIKPENILILHDLPVVADFGLVHYPGKRKVTGAYEKLGPRNTIDPEMRNGARGKDGKAADVFELAKTLWILLTDQWSSFEGQYHREESPALKNHINSINFEPLDSILRQCTSLVPDERPTMRGLKNALNDWLDLENDYVKKSTYQWNLVPGILFPVEVPDTSRWNCLSGIINILNTIGKEGSYNYMFYPTGGGLMLRGAKVSDESGCLELITHGGGDILRPDFLLFESFPRHPNWNYLWLELGPLSPSGVYEIDEIATSETSIPRDREEVVDIASGVYIDAGYWETQTFRNKPLPKTARRITRLFRGSIVIFMKNSPYNEIAHNLSVHMSYDHDSFRSEIESCAKVWDEGVGEQSTGSPVPK